MHPGNWATFAYADHAKYMQGVFQANSRLKAAVRLFEGQIHGPESVVVGPAGQLVMLDRYNQLHEAWWMNQQGWQLTAAPLAKLGPGRPLGYHFDHNAQGFYYANGVALSKDDSYVVMAETDRLRVHKIWLKGPKAGQAEILIDQLPGVPDGVDTSLNSGVLQSEDKGSTSDGSAFWISLVSAAPPFSNPVLCRFLSNPVLRAISAWLPPAFRPGLKKWTAVVKVDGTGQVLDFLMDGEGAQVSSVSAVSESSDGKLWLGNLVGSYVSYVALEPPPSTQ
eukprot:gene9351-9514_t